MSTRQRWQDRLARVWSTWELCAPNWKRFWWRRAQLAEATFWEARDTRERNRQLVAIGERHKMWLFRLNALVRHGWTQQLDWSGLVVADIGSGPTGAWIAIEGARLVLAIDPLMHHYKEWYLLPQGDYIVAKGEALPLVDGCLDIEISTNALDHCENPGEVIAEIRRALRPGGVFLLSVRLRSRMEVAWARVKGYLKLLIGQLEPHPHSFTTFTLTYLLAKHSFKLLGHEVATCKEHIFVVVPDDRMDYHG